MTNLGSSKSTKEHARISGNVVITSVSLSGATISASISGQPVFVYISGGTLTTTVDISGQVVQISGESVIAKTSGQVAQVSGQTVFTVPQYNTFEAAATGVGAVALTLSVTSTYIVDYATYHATSGTTTSSELYIELRHGAGAGYYTKLVSVDMINNVSNIYWTPDADLWLTSGDSIAMVFSNPDTCAYGAAIRVKRP